MKKFLVFLLAMLLCLTFAAAEDKVTAYDFESGVPGQFLQSGSATPAVSTAVFRGGAASLHVKNRSGNNWDAVDLNAKALGIDVNVPAKITAWVYVDSDAAGTFVIAKAGGDYATLGSVNCAGKTWTEITAEINLDQPVNIRFQNLSENWNNAEYYIDDMVVTVGEADAVAESTGPALEYKSDFSAGTDGWYARSAGGASVYVTDEMGLMTIGRTATWNSPGRDFELATGKTYSMSVLVKQDQVDSTGFILSVAHTRDGSESYENLATCTAKKGEWTLMQCTYVAGRYDKFVLYIEGGAADTEYQIKDFTCAEQTLKYGKAGIPSLKEVYAPYFVFGTAVTGNEVLDADRMEFYKSQFDIFTPGNEMKPDALINIAACKSAVRKTGDETVVEVKFDRCKPLLDWAQENGVKVHGHTLVWHSQTPDQFFHEGYNSTSPLVSREVMLGRLENYIRQVLTWTEENYPGVIVSWDVVNEAAADSGRKLRDSLWTQVVGQDFINRAFEYARKYAAPHVKLYYNDYNSEMTMKALVTRDIVDSLIADGTIDGYGFQSHYSVGSTNLFYVEIAMKEMAKRVLNDGTPIRLRVSELDVGIPSNTDSNWQTQARYYKQLMELYLKFADQMEAVHTWGTVDNLSWRKENYPLLFDGQSQPKPAFYAIVD
ncbi:MAG: endo-1,4-beta-xylanase [Clostridia bacterium]|nr:endo-1,4-beta-xylanase [Clostridia bacterium]